MAHRALQRHHLSLGEVMNILQCGPPQDPWLVGATPHEAGWWLRRIGPAVSPTPRSQGEIHPFEVVVAFSEGGDEVLGVFGGTGCASRPGRADVFAKRPDEVRHLCEGTPGVASKSGDHSFQIDGASLVHVGVLVAALVGILP